MRTNRRLGSLALAAALVLSVAACGDDDNGVDSTATTTKEKIVEAGKLRVGIKFDQPLFGLKNPTTGAVEGFDAEIAKLVARELGLDEGDIEFIEAVSKNREPFIEEGKVDIVIATYTINDRRKNQVAFAGPYYIAGQDIMVKAGDTSIKSVTDLNGKNVCSVTGSTSEKNIKEKAPQAKVILFDTYTKCAEALLNGQTQAVSTDNVILLGLIDKLGKDKLALVGNPFTEEPYGIGLKKGDDEFRDFLNDTLEKIYTDGSWAKAFAATVGKVAQTPTPPPVDRYDQAAVPVIEITTGAPQASPTSS